MVGGGVLLCFVRGETSSQVRKQRRDARALYLMDLLSPHPYGLAFEAKASGEEQWGEPRVDRRHPLRAVMVAQPSGQAVVNHQNATKTADDRTVNQKG